jgi:hypothetical protein
MLARKIAKHEEIPTDDHLVQLKAYALRGDAYQEIVASEVLPEIDLVELASFLDRPTASQAIRAYRAALESRR